MSTKPRAYFMEVADFKAFIGITKLDIMKDKQDPTKRAIKAGSIWLKIQKEINFDERMVFITDKVLSDGRPDWLQACLINAKEGERQYVMEKSI